MKKRNNQKKTRKDKVEERFVPAPKLRGKNWLQDQYISAINNSPITIATGYPGTGKTYIPTKIASEWLKREEIDQIILVRPAVSASQSLGFFKGTKEEKMLQWLAPVIGALKEEFSPGDLSYRMKEEIEQIAFTPLETIKGNSWKNSFIIIDEAEDCTIKELKSIFTRIGTRSRLVLCGDIKQSDLTKSGIAVFLEMREKNEAFQKRVAHIDFDDPESIVRSETCRDMVLGFEEFNIY